MPDAHIRFAKTSLIEFRTQQHSPTTTGIRHETWETSHDRLITAMLGKPKKMDRSLNHRLEPWSSDAKGG